MPLKRSPPPAPTPTASDNLHPRAARALAKSKQRPIDQAEKITALSNTSDDDDRSCSAQSERSTKRKIETSPGNSGMQSAVAEMRVLFANMNTKHEEQFASLQATICSIKTEVSEVAKSVEFLTQKYEEFQCKLVSLEAEKQDSQKYIEMLENKVELLERRSKNSCIELRNVAKVSQLENKGHLCNLMSHLGTSLCVSIQDYDIKDIYRINTKSESHSPITVEFTSVIKKEAVINSIRNLNRGKKKEDKLNSTHMKLGGPPVPVFVSESLSQRARKLLFLARDFAKTNEYRFCWSTNGNIYLRKAENQPSIRVASENDLKKLQSDNVK